MKPLTILHTIESSEPGGAETVLLDLASRLDPRRFRSVVLLIKEGWLRSKLAERGVKTYFAECGVWYDFRLPRAIARVVRAEGADLIHSHLPDQNFYSCLAATFSSCKVITTYHGPIEISRAPGARQEFKLWYTRHKATAVVVVCDYVGRMLLKAGFPEKKLVRIYNGIEIERFRGAGTGSLRSALGLSDGTKLVGMVAHLHAAKGYEFFIEAARAVADSVPDVCFLAVGELVERNYGRLAQLVQKLDLGAHFRFLGLREDVPAILNDLDVFVLSSVSEGLPLAVLEAMAAGCPVVVTRSGGPEEFVDDGETGLLAPAGDPAALAARIRELLFNPGRAAELGRKASAKVEVHFTIARMVENYGRLYERVMAAG